MESTPSSSYTPSYTGSTMGVEVRPGSKQSLGAAEREACAQTCLDCARACMELVDHCLQQGAAYNQPGHIRQLLVCSRLCELTSEVLQLGSAEYDLICKTCAEVCFHTAEDFEAFPENEKMRFTAHLSQRCGEECLLVTQLKT